MKVVLILFISLLVFFGYMAPVGQSAGEEIIAGGIELAFINAGDACFEMGISISGDRTSYGSNISTAVFHVSTFTINPFELDPVIEVQKKTAILFIFIAAILIFVYGIQAILAHFRPRAAQTISYLTGQSHYAPLPELVFKISRLFVIMMFIDFLLLLVLGINYIFSSMIMVDVIKHINVAPDNPYFYFCFGFLYLVMNLFYMYRGVIICVIAAYGLIIGALYVIECTNWIAVGLFGYYVVMVFMQSIVIAVCAIIIPLIENGVNLSTGLLYLPAQVIIYLVSYFILLLVLVIIGTACVLSPVIIAIVHILLRKVNNSLT